MATPSETTSCAVRKGSLSKEPRAGTQGCPKWAKRNKKTEKIEKTSKKERNKGPQKKMSRAAAQPQGERSATRRKKGASKAR